MYYILLQNIYKSDAVVWLLNDYLNQGNEEQTIIKQAWL